jgi:hypothetical protein
MPANPEHISPSTWWQYPSLPQLEPCGHAIEEGAHCKVHGKNGVGE